MGNLGKRMAHMLRHAPDTYGLELDLEGAISINDIARVLGVSMLDVIDEITDDDKGRFGTYGSAIEGLSSVRVYARHGHTIPNGVPKQDVVAGDVEGLVLYHGTTSRVTLEILHYGIKPMSREYVHLAASIEEATSVAKRQVKSGEQVTMLQVRAEDILQSGRSLFKSESGIYLTPFVVPEIIMIKE